MGLIDPANPEVFLQTQREDSKIIDFWSPYLFRMYMEHILVSHGFDRVQEMSDMEILVRYQIVEVIGEIQKEQADIQASLAQI